MKKTTIIVAFFFVLFSGFAFAASGYYKSYPVVSLFVDGKEVISSDVPAFLMDGRVVVPLRLVGEALGANVEWDNANQSVIVNKTSLQAREKPKKELIQISDINMKVYASDTTWVSGNVKNNNSDSVDANVTIYFRNPQELIGHIHVYSKSIPAGGSVDFNVEGKGNLPSYSRMEVVIDYLDWN